MRPEPWTEANPTRIAFGPGAVSELSAIASGSVLVVTTHGAVRRGMVETVLGNLDGSAVVDDAVRSNPTIEEIQAALTRHGSTSFDWIIGLGGGSALDVAKVLSVGLPAGAGDQAVWFPIQASWADVDPIPVISVPTTAGTGSEVTPFATVWDSATHLKHSVGTPRMYPKVALVDPDLTTSLPWDVTLSTGLDALSQCVEAILNRRRTAETSAIAERGMELVPDALRALRDDLGAASARASMSEAALRSGLAISVTRTGLAHSMSYPLTAHLGVPHGLACAVCLLPVVGFTADEDDGSVSDLATRLHVGGEGLVAWLEALYEDLGVREAARSLIGTRGVLLPLVPEMYSPERADNSLRAATSSDVQGMVEEIEAWLWEETA